MVSKRFYRHLELENPPYERGHPPTRAFDTMAISIYEIKMIPINVLYNALYQNCSNRSTTLSKMATTAKNRNTF